MKKALAPESRCSSGFSGFTLIELLVVIVIIGVLATLATVALSSARSKARDARRLSDLKQISTALELYMADENVYPSLITAGQPMVGLTSGKTYMSKMPNNPGGSNIAQANDQYSYFSNGSKYTLRAYTENSVNDLPAGGIITSNSGGILSVQNYDNNYWDEYLKFNNNLIGNWDLNNNTLDKTTNSNDCTGFGNAPAIDRFGRLNGSMMFGTTDNDRLVCGNASSLLSTVISISVWVKPNSYDKHYPIFVRKGDNYRMGLNGVGLGKVFFRVIINGVITSLTSLTSVPINTWTHVVGTYDGTYMRVYLNGSINATSDSFPGTITASTDSFIIGAYASGGTYSFDGSIGDVRLYDRALLDAEVLDLYNATKP